MNLSAYHKERRATARAAGLCIQCNQDESEEGKSKCAGCRAANKAKRVVIPRNNSEIVRKGNATRKMLAKTR